MLVVNAGCECRHRCTLLRSESGRHWIWTQVCLHMEGACRIFSSHPLVVLGVAADENRHAPSACRANLSSNPVFQDRRWQQSDSTHFRVCRYYVIFLSIFNFGCDASCKVAMYQWVDGTTLEIIHYLQKQGRIRKDQENKFWIKILCFNSKFHI